MENSRESELFVLKDVLQSFVDSLDEIDVEKIDAKERDNRLKRCMGINDEVLQELHGEWNFPVIRGLPAFELVPICRSKPTTIAKN